MVAQQPEVVPASPRAPRTEDELNSEWADQLTRWLEAFVRIQTGVPYGRFSGLYLPSLPTSGYNLKPGEVFANDGILTVVREDDIWAGGFEIEVSVGTVTVSI